VSRQASLHRGTLLYAQSQTAEAAFLIEQGLVKLTRNNGSGGRIILMVCGPGQLVGEEVFSTENKVYYTSAEVLTSASVIRIPRDTLVEHISADSNLGSAMVHYILEQKLSLAEKVELLCLHDVEYRILHYLAELTQLVGAREGEEHQIPITQLELADLVGATRETTSTTLNNLERRGLVKLSRRLLSIPSPSQLREAAQARAVPRAAAASHAGQEQPVTP
jgi:CRP/FNR family transcriptional regulator